MSIKLTRSQAWPLVKHVFGDYKGRKFKIEFSDHITLWNTLWDGGSKNEYAMVSTDGVSYGTPTLFNHGNGERVDVPRNAVLLQRTWFCGHEFGVTIYVNPAHAPRWIEMTTVGDVGKHGTEGKAEATA